MRFSGGTRAYMAKIFLASRSPPKIACDFRGGQEHIWLRFFCRAGPPRKSHAIFGGDKSIYGSVKKTCEKNPPGSDLRSVPRVFLSDRRSVKKSRKTRESGQISEEEKVSKSEKRPSPQIPRESEGTRNRRGPCPPKIQ